MSFENQFLQNAYSVNRIKLIILHSFAVILCTQNITTAELNST